jgi:hypothetical protein
MRLGHWLSDNRKESDNHNKKATITCNVINLSNLTTLKKARMQNASSLFLTAGPRLSNVARVFDNSSALRKQIVECFLTSDNIGPTWKQIVTCSSPIRQFRSTVLSGLLSWVFFDCQKKRDNGNVRIYLPFPLSLICRYP